MSREATDLILGLAAFEQAEYRAAHKPEQLPTLPGKVDGIIAVEPARLQCRECGDIWTNEEMVGGRDCWPLIFIESGYGFHRHDPQHPRRLCRECLTAARAAHGCSEGTR